MESPRVRSSVSKFIFVGCGIWLIGLGMYFMVMRPPLLPEDLRYMGTSLGEIRSLMPGLERWLRRVFTVMGGFISGAGLLTIFVAVSPVALRKRATAVILAIAGLLTVGTMSVTNFQLDSDFKWLLLIPSLFWIIGVIYHIEVTEGAANLLLTRTPQLCSVFELFLSPAIGPAAMSFSSHIRKRQRATSPGRPFVTGKTPQCPELFKESNFNSLKPRIINL